MKLSVSILMIAMIVGCEPAAKKSSSAPMGERPPERRVMTLGQQLAQPAPGSPKDAPPPVSFVFQVDIFLLTAPFGAVSGNEEFWKRMDEHCVDPATYDVLYRNGIRVGQAHISELEFFKQFMQDRSPMQKLSTLAPEAQRIEIDMTKELPAQTIAVFDAGSALTLRDYDRSANLMNLSFSPAPRKPGAMRISLCPMVRASRKHIEYTQLNNENEIQFVTPEMLYDLNLRADIPKDRFFLVMPSPAARGPLSVGRAFLTKQGHTEQQEQILLIIPRPMIVSDEPIVR